MKIALFDLDQTLIAGDSDAGWGDYLVEQGIVDGETYGKQNQQFFADYKAGQLDIHAYLRFQLNVLSQHPVKQLQQWRADFVEQKIKPWVLDKGLQQIAHHQAQNAVTVIITSTNYFVAEPIAKLLNIPHLIATRPVLTDNAYTGDFEGIITFSTGKIKAFQQWQQQQGYQKAETWFYSDSHNDLPLLKHVDHPIVVDGDAQLLVTAQQKQWKIMSFR